MAAQRIIIVGSSGSGKTTFGKALALKSGIAFHELDSHYWQPDWTASPLDLFRQKVEGIVSEPSWIIEGHDSKVRDITWPKADLIIWLDQPLRVTLYRTFTRSLFRIMKRAPLWNKNTESFKRAFLTKDSPLYWALKSHRQRKIEYEELFQNIKDIAGNTSAYHFIPKLRLSRPQIQVHNRDIP